MKELVYLKTFENFEYEEQLNEDLRKKWNKHGDFDKENPEDVANTFREILGEVTKTDYAAKRWDLYYNWKGELKKSLNKEEVNDMVKLLNKVDRALEKDAKRVSLVGSKENSIGMDVAFDRSLGSLPELR